MAQQLLKAQAAFPLSFRAILLLFSCVGLAQASGQSQKPSSAVAPTTTAAPPEKSSASPAPALPASVAHQQPNEYQRGSEQNPVVVKVYKAAKSEREAHQEQEDRSEHATTDTWTIIIGVGTLIVLSIQAGVFFWQGRQLRRTVSAMQAEYATSHRPKIRIRRIEKVSLVAGQPITATIQASNIGETKAKVVRVGIDIFFRPLGTGRDEINAVPNDIEPVQIPAGKDAWIGVRCRTVSQDDIQKFQSKASDLCALGIVAYEDDAGIERNTSFFRIFDRDGERFRAAPDDPRQGDREFED